MAEVIGCVSLALESTMLCVRVINLLTKFIEAVKSARQELQDLIGRTERNKHMFELLRTALIRVKESDPTDFFFTQSLAQYKNSMLDLERFAHDLAAGKPGLTQKLKWMSQKPRVQKLTQNLKDQEDDILKVVMMVNTKYALRSEEQTLYDATKAVSRTKLEVAFEDLDISDDETQVGKESIKKTRVLHTWLGHVDLESYSKEYRDCRDELADAAKFGYWDEMRDLLVRGQNEFGENWVDAVRLKPKEERHLMSSWTPLHQAVYMRAPLSIARHLLDLGASRTLRTRYTEFEDKDMTALDLAYLLEVKYMYGILAPTICTPVPFSTLQALQTNFHNLIKTELGQLFNDYAFHLPGLEPCTEVRHEPTWFPIHASNRKMGFAFMLDSRELLVQAVHIHDPGETKYFRVNQEGYLETEGFVYFTDQLDEDDEV